MAKKKLIIGSDLASELTKDLSMYSEDVSSKIRKSTKKATAGLVQTTKETAPVGRRRAFHYFEDITSRSLESSKLRERRQWYVEDPNYRLSHLLDKGHEVRGGRRHPGTKFIEKAEDETRRRHTKEVEEIIKNGH